MCGVSMVVPGSAWVCVGVRGCAQVWACGCGQVCADVGACSRVCVGVHGCSWVCMGVGGSGRKGECAGVHGCMHVCGMNFQNFFWRIESLHQWTLICILYEFF